MSETFEVGQKVKFNTNFYTEDSMNVGTGVIERFEACINPSLGGEAGTKCDCGAGGTYFVKIDGALQTGAYIGKELSAV